MTPAQRLGDIWKRVLDQTEVLTEKADPYFGGGPPGTKQLSGPAHVAWLQQEVGRMRQLYEPAWYVVPGRGPVFESLWVLTRQYVQGWADEFARYGTELQRMQGVE